jgi:hypothetical protein
MARAVIATLAVVPVVAAVIVPTLVPTLIPAVIPAIIPAITMLFAVTGHVDLVVPTVPHKVDPLAAGVVLAAVSTPILGVIRRYMQVDRLTIRTHPLGRNGPAVNHLRLGIAEVNASIEAGFANADGYTDIGRECRSGAGDQYCCE